MSANRGSTPFVSPKLVAAGLVVLGALWACTDTYLFDERSQALVPADRTVAIEGDFCTPSPNEVVRPIKIVLAMDASQSMGVTDPNGTRATALVELFRSLPKDPEIYVTTMVFAGSTTGFLTRSSLPDFEQLVSLTQQDITNIEQRLLNFSAPGNNANRDATDFVKPLSDIYALISRDIANTRLMKGNETRARYSVIFLSDGQPTVNQDDELLCGDAVTRVRQLKDLADDVKVNTVHVFVPTQPITSTVCDLDGGTNMSAGGATCRIPTFPPGACPLLIVNTNAERLSRMAQLGGGDFRDFRNNEPVNFLSFNFGQVRRAFTMQQVVASNLSAPPGSPLDAGDTDSDGLYDSDEDRENTNPFVADTDGDGFSDGVEVHFRDLGASFRPNQIALPDGGGLDPGCPLALRGVDTDCDTLTDCDEQIIGTNANQVDSDDDGIPDAVEWQMRTQPSSKDLGQDPDNDGVLNGDEVLMHQDPLNVDTAKLTTTAYRYQVNASGNVDADGRQCYHFRIDNIALADTRPDTRDAGNPDGGAPLYRRGAGYNDVYLSFASKPADDPTGRTLIRHYRHQSSRFPVGGIKSPPDGLIRVTPPEFVERCGATQTTGP